MRLRPYQAPRRQPKINDMLYPPGSRQPGNVWVGGFIMNVPETSSSIPTTPTPTPSITPTQTITPTPSITPTQTITPTNTGTPTQTPTNTATPTPTNSNTPTPSITPSSTPPASGTTEANAYLSRVVAAGGTLNSTISAATRTLFTSLVSNNLYDKLFVFYPHLGGVSASNALNGKSSGFTLTFNGGWTFDSNGSKPNGTNAYAGNVLSPATFGTQNSSSVGALLNTTTTDTTGGNTDMGCLDYAGAPSRYYFSPYFSQFTGGSPRIALNSNVGGGTGLANQNGTYIMSRTGSTDYQFYTQGSLTNNIIATSDIAGTNIIILAAENEAGTVKFYSDRRHGFTFMGSGLSGSEASTLTTIINTWASAISRTV